MASQEQKKSYAVLKKFRGLNTKANRTAIGEDEFSWIENAMPIGDANIKIVPAPLVVANSTSEPVVFANTVSCLESSSINNTDYIVGFETNGSAEAYNLISNVMIPIAGSGNFSNANVSSAQWKNERLIIGDPDKGLFTWDANSIVSIGSVGLIVVSNPGSGYTSAPSVTISSPNDANGVQATATATIVSGSGGIRSIFVTSGGSGYTAVPNVTIGAPNIPGGTQATAVCTISGGAVVSVSMVENGSGYTKTPSVTFSSGGATATAVVSTGGVNSVNLTNAGSGYTSPPTVTFSGGDGSGASAISQIVTFKTGTVSIFLNNGGAGYTSVPTVTINGANTTPATATAIVLGNTVSSIVMTNPGAGYTTANVTISGGGANVSVQATATAVVNTDQIVSVATFSGRVWVAAGRTIYYSAVDSYSDFTSISAGSFTLKDSTLHGNIRALLSANNFLYIFGDDSINVFSDVRVDANGQTLFTNTNVSASIGTKRIYAIFPFFRSVLFMNDYGIYSLVGSTTSKLSDSLDGVFPNIDFDFPVTGGQVLLNNILCAAFNFTYNDPENGARQVQAVFFEKKWFITSQGTLNYITSVPFSGMINAYGVNDRSLYKLYANSAANISSMVQTALMPMGDPIRTKQALKFGVESTFNKGATINVTVDSELGSSPEYALTNFVTWTNNAYDVIPWANSSNAIINWYNSYTYYLYKSDAQQYGKYLGLTITGNQPAYTYNTFEFEHELRVRF